MRATLPAATARCCSRIGIDRGNRRLDSGADPRPAHRGVGTGRDLTTGAS